MPFPQRTISRRAFVKSSSAIAAFSLLPSGLLANSPNGRLQVAQIGVGGRGNVNLRRLLPHRRLDMVAICDVDALLLAEGAGVVPAAQTFRDYRLLFDQLSDKIDAVVVSTPDHMHAPNAKAAMLRGKHVYCEKPLTHNIAENRELQLLAESTGLTTQLGIQNASSIAYRMTYEYIRRGLIGRIKEVHVWSNREWGHDETTPPTQSDPVPANLNWNLWLGVGPDQEYKDGFYHPDNWRKLLAFGTGTLGDMGVHIFDTPYRALELTAPVWVRATCRAPNGFAHPTNKIVEYGFAPTAYTTKAFKWQWYDGLNAPPASIPGVTLPADRKYPEQGCVLVGELGAMLIGHPNGPQTLPPELIQSVPRPELKPIDHHGQWVDACLGIGETGSPFSYGGPLCEVLQLGIIASRFPEEKLLWDPAAMKILNFPSANQYLSRNYRDY